MKRIVQIGRKGKVKKAKAVEVMEVKEYGVWKWLM
jgi:hypothetical protein